MERKIGEIFEYQGEWYQCVKDDMYDYCKGCTSFENLRCTTLYGNSDCWLKATCKKLEKVGEPYKYYIKCVEGVDFIIVQEYILPNPSYIWNDEENVFTRDCYNGRIAIEIKQTKEDMEETNFIEKLETLCKRYNMPDGVRTDFISEVKEIIKDKEECNFKPFNLKAAKAGKPVCTRDGHKARIICFDRKGYNMFPIVALIMNDDRESDIYTYRPNGTWNNSGNESDKDLMMLPEKKEGWVNVYYDNDASSHRGCRFIYDTKEQAVKEAGSAYITTVKIEWEE